MQETLDLITELRGAEINNNLIKSGVVKFTGEGDAYLLIEN